MELQNEEHYNDRSKLQYQSVKAKGYDVYGDYRLTYYRREHIMLKHVDIDESKTRGWKFHISINIEDVSIMEEVWNIIAPILIKHGVKLAKFIKSEVADPALERNLAEAGRQGTIFANLNPEFSLDDWRRLFQEIIHELKEHQIRPGVPNKVCKLVEGSEGYIMYRNDLVKKESDPKPLSPIKTLPKHDPLETVSHSPVPRLIIPSDVPLIYSNEEETETYIGTEDVFKAKRIPANMKFNPGNYPDIFRDLTLIPELSIEEQFEQVSVLVSELQTINDRCCCC